jgi:hypothetical protein
MRRCPNKESALQPPARFDGIATEEKYKALLPGVKNTRARQSFPRTPVVFCVDIYFCISNFFGAHFS